MGNKKPEGPKNSPSGYHTSKLGAQIYTHLKKNMLHNELI